MSLSDVVDSLVDDLQQEIRHNSYQNNAIEWIKDAFGEEYVPAIAKVRDSIDRINEYRQQVIYGNNSSGKSFSWDMMSLWWVVGRGVPNSKCMVISGASQQIKGWFGYISTMLKVNHERYEQGLTSINIQGKIIQQSAFRVGGVDIIIGRSPTQARVGQRAQALLGAHSLGGTLTILEEADGLSDTTCRSALRLVTGKNDKIVALTNPNNPESYILQACKWYELMLDGKPYEKNLWEVTQIGWSDMPTNPESSEYNTDIPVVQFENLLQQAFIDEVIYTYGIDSPQYNIYVLGRFDYINKLSLITQLDINAGIATVTSTHSDEVSRPVIGLDLALFGENKSVAYIKYVIPTSVKQCYTSDEHKCSKDCKEVVKNIARIRFLDSINKVDQVEQAIWITKLCQRHDVREVRADASGLGAPFVRTLRDKLSEFELDTLVVGVVVGRRELAGNQYLNDRAYYWGTAKEQLQLGLIDISETDDNLINELKSVGYSYDVNDKIVLQSKQTMAFSPDNADAFILATILEDDIEFMMCPKVKEEVIVPKLDNLYIGRDGLDTQLDKFLEAEFARFDSEIDGQ